MKTMSIILQRSRWNLTLLLAFVGAGTAMAVISSYCLQDARHENRLAVGQHRETQEKLAHVRDEQQAILRKLSIYRDIAARGYVGEERRRDWIEQIRKIKAKRKLIDIRYELAMPQPDSNVGKAGIELIASNMKLHMQLLHEEDLLNFLDDLRHSAPAYLRIRSCNVERLSAIENSAAQLKAECSIDWVTWRVRSVSKASQT